MASVIWWWAFNLVRFHLSAFLQLRYMCEKPVLSHGVDASSIAPLSFDPLHMNKELRLLLALLASGMVLGANAQCCDYLLNMSDSYGDGWNGGQLTVSVNGAPVGTFAAVGSGSTASFTICNGDQLTLSYASGEWENENTYQVFGPAGNFVFGDGPDPAIGTVFTGVGDCDQVPPPGAVPCAALPIDTVDCLIVDNSGLLGSGLSPGCANFQGGDIWFTMPVPPSGNVSVATASTNGLNDTGIAMWTGTDCTALTLRGCDDDGGDDYFSLLSAYELPPGQTLFIQAFGYGGGTGAFELCVSDLGTVTLESSELPIVMINTLDQDIPFDGRIDAVMDIKYNGPGNLTSVSDPSNEYSGAVGIGVRGATSAGYPQRPYNIETRTDSGTNNNVPIMGLPAENDWFLLSNYNDRSLVRNALAFSLARQMGEYAPRTHLCEVLIDSVYKGIYTFGEKIKRDAGRVAIATLNVDENTGDDLTGGYILQQNLRDANNSFQSNFSPIDHPGFDVHFLYEYPEPEVISPEQRNYIASYVDTLETALYSPNYDDPETGYRSYLDVPSFITYFLVNELARNNDGFKKSVFFHKDKNSNGGRLKAGPVWDFDWAWKTLYGCSIFENNDGSGWAHLINDCPTDNYSCGWYVRLLQDSTFNAQLRCTYEDHRSSILSNESIFAYIDSVGALVQNAQARHFQKWPILGVSGPAPEVFPVATTYAAELDSLKGWIGRRLIWLDANIPGLCTNVAVREMERAPALAVYPNPSTGQFRFQGDLAGSGPWTLSVVDVSGREVQRVVLAPGAQLFDHTIPWQGAYTYVVRRGKDAVQQGRLIVL
jgi:hypothetical protein